MVADRFCLPPFPRENLNCLRIWPLLRLFMCQKPWQAPLGSSVPFTSVRAICCLRNFIRSRGLTKQNRPNHKACNGWQAITFKRSRHRSGMFQRMELRLIMAKCRLESISKNYCTFTQKNRRNIMLKIPCSFELFLLDTMTAHGFWLGFKFASATLL